MSGIIVIGLEPVPIKVLNPILSMVLPLRLPTSPTDKPIIAHQIVFLIRFSHVRQLP